MGLAKILENIMLNFCKGMYCWILVVDLVVDWSSMWRILSQKKMHSWEIGETCP